MKPNMTIEFCWQGVAFVATGYYLPGRPAQTYGPPENCYPEESPEFDIETLKVETGKDRWVDALWALDTPIGDDILTAAIEAIESDRVDDWFGGYDYDPE